MQFNFIFASSYTKNGFQFNKFDTEYFKHFVLDVWSFDVSSFEVLSFDYLSALSCRSES